nr:uncharacterized protein LOC114819244 [Malus domestica]
MPLSRVTLLLLLLAVGFGQNLRALKQMFWSSSPKAERQNWDSGRNSCANHFSHLHVSFSKYLNLDKLANSMGDGTEVLDVQAAAKLILYAQNTEACSEETVAATFGLLASMNTVDNRSRGRKQKQAKKDYFST